ncbi:hypothetical protein [Pedobacter sandarakinus]|uniref:hypothetical protein n=1 Tax=Pedobacter sandarakinus TaxID=353156 RepID=UPI0022479C98|nr:hypothetical protein [Pedobacter sandarakinus]MCX2576353.1 hypothetical protein [Pedobacter sandarakinus]
MLKDNEPNMLTIMALSASCSFPVGMILQIILIKKYCNIIDAWQLFLLIPFFILINYFYFFRSGRFKIILEKKPKILNSNLLSIFCVILFFLITISFMFLGPIYAKEFLVNHCGR